MLYWGRQISIVSDPCRPILQFDAPLQPPPPPSPPHSRLFPSSTSSIQKLSYYQLVRKLMCKSNTYFSLDVSLIQILAWGSLQMLKHFSRNATNSKRKTKNLGHEKSEKFRRGIHKVVSEINARETKLSEGMSDYSDKKKSSCFLTLTFKMCCLPSSRRREISAENLWFQTFWLHPV